MGKEWFESWFDSPYYHVLYKGRNDAEAALLIDNLIPVMDLKQGDSVWDLCCGRGRHSIYLSKKGYRTIGTDLSRNSICMAREHETDHLDFYVHDMRQPFMVNFFDAVFNLFTSFGYFADDRDNHKVFRSVYNSLKPNGLFVIDYFNSILVKRTLTPDHSKEVDGIHFKIHKAIHNNTIVKDITFADKHKTYHYKEEVRLFDKAGFCQLAEANGFRLLHAFGDYHLHAFNAESSPRLILVFQKQ